ncbi:VOC family protein [uncultured Microbulbifer sp.]|uniref:VOC family protein n=1 Tax=uncultured Microbulbifer sp. TaxID=348147 RepID=UPI00261B1E0B|nr:VOC family protein [uncultured Microbulbifer sp.]
MFSHVMVGANDIEKAKAFYDAALGALEHKPGVIDEKGRCFYITNSGVFIITKPINGEPACHANGGTIGFSANNTGEVDAWHSAGLENGGIRCEDPPGIREAPVGKLYIAYLRDPDGNKVCAVYKVK